MQAINETVILDGDVTGNGTVLGIPLSLIETERGYFLLVAALAALFASALTAFSMYQHLRAYTRPHLQRYILRILLIVPVYAVGSFLSFKFVHQAAYFNIVRDMYEAFVVYSFLNLVLAFAARWCPRPRSRTRFLGYCCSPMARDGRLLRNCKKATIQFVFLKPFMAVLSLLMLAVGAYESDGFQWLLWIVYNVSYSIALYGLLVFYLATKHILAPFSPVLKFFAVKSVIFLTFWQTLLIDDFPDISKEQAFAWNDFVLALEMAPVAIMYFFSFGASQFRNTCEAIPASEVVKNMKEVLSVQDIVADAYHNFMPSYQDYMLQRADDEFPEKIRTQTFLAGNLDAPVTTKEQRGDDAGLRVALDVVQSEEDKPLAPSTTSEASTVLPDDGDEEETVVQAPKQVLSPRMMSPRTPSMLDLEVKKESIAMPYSMSDEDEDETLLDTPRRHSDKSSLLNS
ncbi:hypothetical protein SPRG_07745 [Saprolegnia parasitica CBS 223.65]|uniref:Uncharacterized protein n=1 Tax=Saprolegnia parasitica (strain CBS 223.65) TaxID=695850 RepID=A0A067C942_SAPPC|nr:hypothetical protein SPRG_07745 [Saprolegnia parasitica CBS 223.65]KDO27033.1 hypothetical protein SPRG_07745 [Saprolegnia parasitica CBS 223.65]|eukprot:XP_012202129.1 hypothetical protein SPRG_07745 [Saprolegnia parasitica CBS 223.65]